MNRDIDLLVDLQSEIELDLDVSHVGGCAENVIEVIQKNGVDLPIENKTVNIEVPTDADIESLIVAHGYVTSDDLTEEVDEAMYWYVEDLYTIIDNMDKWLQRLEENKQDKVLTSPNGTKYKIAVDNDGNLSTVKL